MTFVKIFSVVNTLLILGLLFSDSLTRKEISLLSDDFSEQVQTVGRMSESMTGIKETLLSLNIGDSLMIQHTGSKIDGIEADIQAIKFLANVMATRQRTIDKRLDSLNQIMNGDGVNPFPNVFEGWIPLTPANGDVLIDSISLEK